MSGDLRSAVQAYHSYLSAHPDHYQSEFNLGHALMTLGYCAEAIPHFRRTLQLKPDYHEAHLHLATCYERIGNLEAARRERTQ